MTKSKIEKIFAGVQVFNADAYVADYTESVQLQLAKLQSRSARKAFMENPDLRNGVYIQQTPFTDIQFFHLHNDNAIPYYVVNFEQNKGFFPSGNRDCECLFRYKGKDKGWLLLCELKYNHSEETIRNNVETAYSQLRSTWELCEQNKVFDKRRCRSFLNITLPDFSYKAPFNSFILTQSEKLKWIKRNKIHLMGYNDVLIVNEGRLQVPQE